MARDPVWAFYSEGGHWVLEMVRRVIVDGTDLNTSYGFDETFHYRTIGDDAVCLAGVGDLYGISVNGELLSFEYDEVLHRNCCEPGLYNPRDVEDGFCFFARRGDVFLLVEVVEVRSQTETAPLRE
jgi:hypothetical protein